MERQEKSEGVRCGLWRALLVACALAACAAGPKSDAPQTRATVEGPVEPVEGVAPTREFEVRGDRAWLGGHEVDLWGLRCGNALYSQTVTERHVRALDTMVAHGINLVGVYIQGSNGGWPDFDAGLDGYKRDGSLKKDVAQRLEWLVRECDKRGMVVMVGLFSPRKDQNLEGPQAVRRAVEETARFLEQRGLRNVFVDIAHEFDHTERMDLDLFREPGGEAKKALMTGWFKAVAPGIEVGTCPYEKSPTTDSYAGMDVRIIQKQMRIPTEGFVVNVETSKQDSYENDGVFGDAQRENVYADCERFLEAKNSVMLFHAAWIQGIGNYSSTAPHAEAGGMGTSPSDRGVRFYYEWVRDHAGRWEWPRHVPAEPRPSQVEPVPTREFEIKDGLPFLGGQPVKLWGMRCNNSLLSPATTERLINNLDNMAEHGFNLVSVALQGTNGGFPDVDAGPSAFTSDGKLIPSFARRLELVARACDKRGMVLCVVVAMPRKDQHLRDEAAVQRAYEETGRFLESRKLRNTMVNLFQEFHHPTRIDHEIFREPDGAAKKARIAGWFHTQAPNIEVGATPNHLNGSAVDFPGCDIQMIHEAMPIPSKGFVLNTELPEEDQQGNEGVFNAQGRRNLERAVEVWSASPRLAVLFRSPYVEDVRGRQGVGPCSEMGGDGKGESDRGVRFYYQLVQKKAGRWVYPQHEPVSH
jgi:hypothetical protein